MSVDELTDIALAPEATTTDDFTRTHILNCPENKKSTEAWLTEARVFGLEVEALCGYKWVPQRDPQRFSVCEACLGVVEMILAEGG